MIFRPVVVDGDLDIVPDGVLLDDRQILVRRRADHHREAGVLGVLEVIVDVVVVFAQADVAAGDDFEARTFKLPPRCGQPPLRQFIVHMDRLDVDVGDAQVFDDVDRLAAAELAQRIGRHCQPDVAPMV